MLLHNIKAHIVAQGNPYLNAILHIFKAGYIVAVNNNGVKNLAVFIPKFIEFFICRYPRGVKFDRIEGT